MPSGVGGGRLAVPAPVQRGGQGQPGRDGVGMPCLRRLRGLPAVGRPTGRGQRRCAGGGGRMGSMRHEADGAGLDRRGGVCVRLLTAAASRAADAPA